MIFSVGSESEEISQEIAFIGRRQRRAVEVAFIAVADEARVEAESFWWPLARITSRGEETAVTCIHHIEAANECGRPLRRRLEEVAQGRNRAVVKIGPVEPQAGGRFGDIAWGFVERLETPIAAFAEIVVGVAGELGPHV